MQTIKMVVSGHIVEAEVVGEFEDWYWVITPNAVNPVTIHKDRVLEE